MKKFILIILVLAVAMTEQQAQEVVETGGFAYGIKGGPVIGFQKWGNFQQRDPLLATHAIAFIESLPADGKFAVFAQAGYHLRGSAIRQRPFTYTDQGTGMPREFPGSTRKFKFKNVALSLGGKQLKPLGEKSSFYYMFGLRGEYTIGTNLRTLDDLNSAIGGLYFPVDDDGLGWVRKWNYGMILGGGIEFPLSDFMGIIIEATFSPDFSNQYNQPPIPNIIDPFTGNIRTINEQVIKNNTIEISVGFRFLRVVEYVE